MGRMREALRHFHRALALFPNDASAIFSIGVTNGPQGLGNLDVALPWLHRFVQLDPGRAGTYVHLAETYRLLGQHAESKAWLERGMRADPRYRHMVFWLAFLEADRGDWNAAKERLEAMMVLEGRTPDNVALSAAVATAFGNRPLAVAYARAFPDSALPGLAGRWAVYVLWVRGSGTQLARVVAEQENRVQQRVRRGGEQPNDCLELAELAAARADRRDVLTYLERYVAAGGRELSMISRNLMFETVREEPRFGALRDRLTRILAQQRQRLESLRASQRPLVP